MTVGQLESSDRRRRASVGDVLDRVLDKGIVIGYRADISAGGIPLSGVEAQIVVASVDTYLGYASGWFPADAVGAAVDGYLRRLGA